MDEAKQEGGSSLDSIIETEELNPAVDSSDDLNSLKCFICKKRFSNKSNLLKHAKKMHGIKLPGNRQNYTCSICTKTESFAQLSGLRKHHVSCHSFVDEVRTLRFYSRAEFNSWKEKEERQTKTRFVAKTGASKLQSGKVKQYYLCHRSGNYVGKGRGKRRLKWQGSCRTGQFCLASMEVTEIYADGSEMLEIIVKYHSNHYGHDFDISHLGTPEQGVNFENFLDKLRDNNYDHFNRLHLMSKRELYNVERKFKFHQFRPLTKDVESLESWLGKSLLQGEQSPVLYCKDRGIEESREETEDCLEVDDFVLVLSNPIQRELLSQFGSSVICLDCIATGMPQELVLTAVIVLDEFEEPFPVAYCLSNRIDFTVFKRFFECLQVQVGCINCSILVSNDIPALHGAWSLVMGEWEHHQLCPWYTEKCWKQLIAHIPDVKKSKHLTVTRWLKTMVKMSDMGRFSDELEAFLEKMEQDDDTRLFISHFKEQFGMRPEMWAHCYLGTKWTAISASLEIMHRSVRNSFFLGKDFTYVVRCITALCRLVRDKNASRLSKMVEGIDSVQGQDDTAGIVVEVVEEDCQWRLQNGWGESFQVQRVPRTCRDEEDSDKSYSCSCIDNLAHSKCCQHITVVMQLQQFQEPPEPEKLVELKDPVSKSLEEERPHRSPRNKSLQQRVRKKANALVTMLKRRKISNATLSQLEEHVDKCLDYLRNTTSQTLDMDTDIAASDDSGSLPRISVSEKVPISRHVSPLSRSDNNIANVGKSVDDVHSGFDHVY